MKPYPHTTNRVTRSKFLLALGTPAVLLAAPGHGDGRLSADDTAEIVDLLYRSRGDTLTKLASLSDKQWVFKAGPGRWSAGEVAEHLYLVETGLHFRVDGLMKAEPSPDWATLSEGKVQVLTQTLPDRTNRFQAPPEVTPKGEMSRTEIVNAYSSARSRMIDRARDRSRAYKAHIEESGTQLGALSAAHWIRFAALHNQRHNKQIDEVMAAAKFPG
jgi:hypothetical protein